MKKSSKKDSQNRFSHRKFSDRFRKASEFYNRYTKGLTKVEVRRLFGKETRDLFYFYADEDEIKEAEKLSPFRKTYIYAVSLLRGVVMKMSPVRRIIFAVAMVIFVIGMVNSDFLYIFLSFLFLNFLLALELADKLTVRSELEIARDVQESLLPHEDPKIKGLDVSSFSKPASEVGGDYYDFFQLADNKLVVAIGDVSGHGMPAGLLMAMAKSCLRTQIDSDSSHDTVMTALNNTIHHFSDKKRMMTFLYAVFDLNDNSLTFANAGHPYPYLYNGGKLKTLELSGYPLGVRKKLDTKCKKVKLAKGDLLLFYSDGLVEGQNNKKKLFGFERLERIVSRCANVPAKDIKRFILEEFYSFMGENSQEDDVTFIVVKVK